MKMNEKYRRVEARFGPEARFEVKPAPPAPYRAVHEDRFERLKAELLAARLETVWEPEVASRLRRAANDAAALAWVSPYPLLVLPGLFEEKADAALVEARRQECVLQRSRELLTA
jgi:hypothetical protein